jgi:hypothetical protein
VRSTPAPAANHVGCGCAGAIGRRSRSVRAPLRSCWSSSHTRRRSNGPSLYEYDAAIGAHLALQSLAVNIGSRARRRGRRPGSLSVSLWLTLIFCALARHQPALPAASDPSAANIVSSAATTRPAPVTPPTLPAFRLGTAARPFGWSTIVGDLNTDGTPDLVIADRTSRTAGGYTYQLQFAISGLEPRQVSFDSRQDALTVGVSDVDHDNDLDVVLSREVVGIWLNDGGGHFEATDLRRFGADAPLLQSVSAWDQQGSAPSGVPPRRADPLGPASATTLALSPDRFPTARTGHLHPTRPSLSAAPRGPPSQPA